jgi:hypothetical protein
MKWVLVWVALAGTAGAEEWRPLTGAEIGPALTARVVQYEDGARQDFMADGRTLYGDSWGKWRVEGDKYCSQWPPSDGWACYGVEVEAAGLDVRFSVDYGEGVVGRYVDLR